MGRWGRVFILCPKSTDSGARTHARMLVVVWFCSGVVESRRRPSSSLPPAPTNPGRCCCHMMSRQVFSSPRLVGRLEPPPPAGCLFFVLFPPFRCMYSLTLAPAAPTLPAASLLALLALFLLLLLDLRRRALDLLGRPLLVAVLQGFVVEVGFGVRWKGASDPTISVVNPPPCTGGPPRYLHCMVVHTSFFLSFFFFFFLPALPSPSEVAMAAPLSAEAAAAAPPLPSIACFHILCEID